MTRKCCKCGKKYGCYKFPEEGGWKKLDCGDKDCDRVCPQTDKASHGYCTECERLCT